MKRSFCLSVLILGLSAISPAQSILTGFDLSRDSLVVNQFILGAIKQRDPIQAPVPLVSFLVDGKPFQSDKPELYAGKMKVRLTALQSTAVGITAIIVFTNPGTDTVQLDNVVPFGEGEGRVYITGKGKHGLSRTHLFVPGKEPVNVIVPDNAWDLGFCTFPISGQLQLAALVRRNRATIKNGTRGRFETKLYPGGSVEYKFYAETLKGDWHTGLQQIFQERMLFDMEKFDNSLYERKDLQWVRHTYVNHLMMNWDKFYYDYTDKKFHVNEFLQRGNKLYGGDDFISIWPTWPTLGLDQRNQFDLFEDLPGGTAKIKAIAAECHANDTKLIICYNPWDASTRSENHFEGISKLIASTSADGMVLDTQGESSKELQDAADKIRPGVIMYSEGMAVPKDMQGIVSGRVHNALYYPPMLNLNKLIKPEFTIYRVAELFKEPIQREFATAFFNGYGTEMNIMRPGQPDYAEEQYKYLGRTSRILRENTLNFVSHGFKPLIETSAEGIWVNEWALPSKTIYTIYSTKPEGYSDYLFEVKPEQGYHFVDLWHHRLLSPKQINNAWWIAAETNSFNKKFLGSNNEGEVDCIAKLPVMITATCNGDRLNISTAMIGDEIRIWQGSPAYDKKPFILKPGKHLVSLNDQFGRFEGDVIIQLMGKGILLDENLVSIQVGESRRISVVQKTKVATATPKGMVKIPAGTFHFKTKHGDEFIAYPKQDVDSTFKMSAVYKDKFPVTNAQYLQFINASKYKPSDAAN